MSGPRLKNKNKNNILPNFIVLYKGGNSTRYQSEKANMSTDQNTTLLIKTKLKKTVKNSL
jgi:hypothetical protein